MLEIPRSEADELNSMRGWVLLHGRRKVGKTYVLTHNVPHDIYVMVRRDGVALSDDLPGRRFETGEMLFDAIAPAVREGGTVIIDEFQRLPDSFSDELATLHPDGRVILSGSSRRILENVVGARAPLLTMVSEYRMGLVRPVDVMRALDRMSTDQLFPYAAYLREPWLSEVMTFSGGIEADLFSSLKKARLAVPALIGEVFTESDRSITRVYEAIIRAMGAGLWRPGDIANRLQNMGILHGDGSNYLRRYIKSLEDMGLVVAVPIHGRLKWMAYRLSSQYLETYYYLADRHGIDEFERTKQDIAHNLRKMVAQAVERFVGQLFCQLEGGQLEYSFDPELDFVMTEGRKRVPKMVGEVRWGRYDDRDVRQFARKVEDLDCRKVFIAPRKGKRTPVEGVEVLGPEDLRSMAEAHRPGTSD